MVPRVGFKSVGSKSLETLKPSDLETGVLANSESCIVELSAAG